ncbi:MAG: DUF2007 domain-containing protein [Acidobacteriota bacterium]|nr:DUF2007 domain-containing protein [Acidobacteriota bacterium]
MAADDLVELTKFGHVHEAELAISTLEAAEIPAVLRDSSYGGIRVETLSSGITVLVRRDQRDAALQLLGSSAEPRGVDIDATFGCAGCGRILPSPTAVCPECNADDYLPVLDPMRTKAAVGNLKVIVVLGTLALMILPVIFSRLAEIRTDVWVVVAYVLVGLAAVVFLFKVLASGSDQRL